MNVSTLWNNSTQVNFSQDAHTQGNFCSFIHSKNTLDTYKLYRNIINLLEKKSGRKKIKKCSHSSQQWWTNKALLFSYNVTFNVGVLWREFPFETFQMWFVIFQLLLLSAYYSLGFLILNKFVYFLNVRKNQNLLIKKRTPTKACRLPCKIKSCEGIPRMSEQKMRRRRCHVALCGEFWSSLPGQPSATSLCVRLAASSDPASQLFGDHFGQTRRRAGSFSTQTQMRTPSPPHPPHPPTRPRKHLLGPNSRKNKWIYRKWGGCHTCDFPLIIQPIWIIKLY